jgi:hypothetical protein
MKSIEKIVFRGLLITIFFWLFLYISIFFANSTPFDDRTFNQQLWLEMDKSTIADNPRGEMYLDLTENYLKKGMTIADVKVLLGSPDLYSTKTQLSYNLGMWSLMDFNSLTIDFSPDGELIKAYMVQH